MVLRCKPNCPALCNEVFNIGATIISSLNVVTLININLRCTSVIHPPGCSKGSFRDILLKTTISSKYLIWGPTTGASATDPTTYGTTGGTALWTRPPRDLFAVDFFLAATFFFGGMFILLPLMTGTGL
jgi:hypothetical protein